MKLRRLAAVLTVLALQACASRTHGSAGGATPLPLPVATGDYPMYGHAADFSWLAGRIERSLACTYVRFGDHRRDQWDGHIALDASPEQLDELKNDDMIVIKGELVRLGDGVCGSPSFIVSTIEEH